MSGVLAELAALSAERVRVDRRDGRSDAELEREALAMSVPVCPLPSRRDQSFGLIAEIKRASPSEGQIAADGDDDLERRAANYIDAGASVISVLTEPSRFGGDRDHLRRVATAHRGVPVLRKDFLVDPRQVFEARLDGASVVLLIGEILEGNQLDEMVDAVARCGLGVLFEAHTSAGLERELDRGTFERVDGNRVALGINSRDLRTMEILTSRFNETAEVMARRGLMQDSGRPLLVAESGMATPSDAAAVGRLGYDLALVGTALMRAPSPADAARAMIEAGRAACVSS